MAGKGFQVEFEKKGCTADGVYANIERSPFV